ncbi:putative oxalocrotonate tautomerase [Mycena rebaudengoi]|nr:putative oxalocrotonate tautomerase [Mycena rebaudengoi]
MPLHRVFVPKGLYTAAEKEAMTAAITNIYTNPPALLPAFYVLVLFVELEDGNFFVGGKHSNRFVRFAVEHIARHFAERNADLWTGTRRLLEPFTKGRGIDWEVQVSECDRLLWNENGMAPPLPNTEEEQIWKKENRAVTQEEIARAKAEA